MNGGNISVNLRRLRLAKGLTQEDLAQAVRITRPAYNRIEKGEVVPRTSTLQKLVKALDVKLVDLFQDVKELQRVRFRAKKSMKSRQQILFEVTGWLKKFNLLEEFLDVKQPYKLNKLAGTLSSFDSGRERAKVAAVQAREVMGIGQEEPIRDICGLIESSGIKVYPLNIANNEFFGLSIAPSDGGPAIAINTWERISVERWVFSAAHELGHLLLHLDSYSIDQEEEKTEEEEEANWFAASFLMPETVFIKEWKEARGLSLVDRVMKVKRIFGVSYKTVLYRLYEAGHREIWKRFYIEYSRKNNRSLCWTEEPQALTSEAFLISGPVAEKTSELYRLTEVDFKPDRLAMLVRYAVEEEVITLSRAAEILNLSIEKMRSLAASWVD